MNNMINHPYILPRTLFALSIILLVSFGVFAVSALSASAQEEPPQPPIPNECLSKRTLKGTVVIEQLDSAPKLPKIEAAKAVVGMPLGDSTGSNIQFGSGSWYNQANNYSSILPTLVEDLQFKYVYYTSEDAYIKEDTVGSEYKNNIYNINQAQWVKNLIGSGLSAEICSNGTIMGGCGFLESIGTVPLIPDGQKVQLCRDAIERCWRPYFDEDAEVPPDCPTPDDPDNISNQLLEEAETVEGIEDTDIKQGDEEGGIAMPQDDPWINDEDENTEVTRVIDEFSDISGSSWDQSLFGTPIGGRIVATIPCLCSGTWKVLVAGPPGKNFGWYTYIPGMGQFPNYRLPFPSFWVLGLISRQFACIQLIPSTPPYCAPRPSQGIVTPIVGSSVY